MRNLLSLCLEGICLHRVPRAALRALDKARDRHGGRRDLRKARGELRPRRVRHCQEALAVRLDAAALTERIDRIVRAQHVRMRDGALCASHPA